MTGKDKFTALVLEQTDGAITSSIETLPDDALPEGDVTVAVAYSTLNYKDGMVLGGLGRIVRSYPHVPGIDLAGIVEASDSPLFKAGDAVIHTGQWVGERRWGGFATRARVNSEWLVPLPDGMTLKGAMAHGTAGLTAVIALMVLEDHGLTPETDREVLVTGAAGGVGSVAVALLANGGYRVAASTGRAELHDYLRDLGAISIVGRAELLVPPKGTLGSERWAAAIDNVGGPILANVMTTLAYGGSCAAVGLAADAMLTTSVVPFLLRAVNLLGINTAMFSPERTRTAWQRLADEVPAAILDDMTTVVPLSAVADLGEAILRGQVRGRTVVDVNA
jgi:acrylyl-CoA reductase (NADPH)